MTSKLARVSTKYKTHLPRHSLWPCFLPRAAVPRAKSLWQRCAIDGYAGPQELRDWYFCNFVIRGLVGRVPVIGSSLSTLASASQAFVMVAQGSMLGALQGPHEAAVTLQTAPLLEIPDVSVQAQDMHVLCSYLRTACSTTTRYFLHTLCSTFGVLFHVSSARFPVFRSDLLVKRRRWSI